MINGFSSLVNIGFRRLLALYFIPSLILIVGVTIIYVDFDFSVFRNIEKLELKSTALYLIVLTLLILMLGYLIDNLGSRWENKYCLVKVKNKISKDCYGANGAVLCANDALKPKDVYNFGWERFLALSYDPKEKTGHRFLRYMVERLKFELNGGFVFYLVFFAGVIKSVFELCYVSNFWDVRSNMDWKLFWLMFVSWVIARWLLSKEAPDSAYSLHETRLILVQKYDCCWRTHAEDFAKNCSNYPSDEEENDLLKKIEWISGNMGKLRAIAFLLSLLLIRHSFKVIQTVKFKMPDS